MTFKRTIAVSFLMHSALFAAAAFVAVNSPLREGAIMVDILMPDAYVNGQVYTDKKKAADRTSAAQAVKKKTTKDMAPEGTESLIVEGPVAPGEKKKTELPVPLPEPPARNTVVTAVVTKSNPLIPPMPPVKERLEESPKGAVPVGTGGENVEGAVGPGVPVGTGGGNVEGAVAPGVPVGTGRGNVEGAGAPGGPVGPGVPWGTLNYNQLAARLRALIEEAIEYPPVSRRKKEEGTVTLRFSVDARGAPTDIEVLESSGYPRLDREAVRTVRSAAPLPPLDRTVELPISFRLTTP